MTPPTPSAASSARPCSPQKTAGEGRMMPSAPLRCFPDLSAFGSAFGSREKRQNAVSLFESINKKVPDFLRNRELFGGDCWTRTSDLLRVKIRCAPESVAPQHFPALLRTFGSVGDPLCPPNTLQSFPRLGHGLGQALRRRRNDHAVTKE